MEDKFPKYASELVDMLVKNIGCPTVEGFGLKLWGDFDDSVVRRMAFLAGQYQLVQALLDWRDDPGGEEDGDEVDGEPLFGSVFGPDGEVHTNVSPPHVAPEPVGTDRGKPKGTKKH